MRIEQKYWRKGDGWLKSKSVRFKKAPQVVLVFGSTSLLKEKKLISEIRKIYAGSHLLGCSTAGEICCTNVFDNSLVVTAIEFESSWIEGAQVKLSEAKDSLDAGMRLAESLSKRDLKHVFVLSDGIGTNGSDLARGLIKGLPSDVVVTGGLAGDGARFKETLVFWDGEPSTDTVAVLGLYGERLKVGYGSLGGWDPFGPERLVTKSKGNVLYELDGKSALELYKNYLGEHAAGLPATALLFPLNVRAKEGGMPLVRTVLSVSDKDQTMTFAGDVPEGAYARFMKANFERLIDGAVGAAKTSYDAMGSVKPELAILISCVGRKMILKQRTEEEVEGARDVLGNKVVLTGFYSYGEIAPFKPGATCELHNQTMTITTLLEI